jgi:hypothetical protein
MKAHEQIQQWLNIDTLHTSDGDETILIWGKDSGKRDVEIIGVSVNSSSNIQSYEPSPMARVSKYLARKADVPFVWLGLEYFDDGSLQVGGGDYNIETLDLKRGATRLQHILGTDLESSGTRKYINESPNSQFDEWSKKAMPSEYVKTDIDALIASSPDKPKHVGIVEMRRTDIDDWNIYSYPEDMYQHVAIWNFLADTGLQSYDYCIVQYQKSVDRIVDSDYVLCTHVDNIVPDKMKWAQYSSYQLPPSEAAQKVINLTHPNGG